MSHVFTAGPLRGTIRVTGDKSISHRALMLGAIAPGKTHVRGANRGADVLATRDAMIALGASIEDDGEAFTLHGRALRDPTATIDARNSGTTTRLLLGLCAGHGITATFDGDASLRRRPMERVARPLRTIGAHVETTNDRLPASVRGVRTPAGRAFELEMPSAQLKSAILLAMLDATGIVRIEGDRHSRDHTERMLHHLGRSIAFDGREIVLEPGALRAADIDVPADLSAAAFFLVAAATTPGSEVTLTSVGMSETRTGVLDALAAMGAEIDVANRRDLGGEPVADVRVRASALHAIDLDGDLVVRAIDEIPILAVAAANARGTTHIRGAADLRAKESDRLRAIATTLAACGVQVTEYEDGLDIAGGTARPPSQMLETYDDHRIAMAIAALASPTGAHEIDGTAAIAVSFPAFLETWAHAQATGRSNE